MAPRAQGADVVDYGMMGTDMMYFAVARDRSRRRRDDHRVAQSEGNITASRWCVSEAFPLSGEAGINDIRDMIASGVAAAGGAARGTRHDEATSSTTT